jgi:hypothetical protein
MRLAIKSFRELHGHTSLSVEYINLAKIHLYAKYITMKAKEHLWKIFTLN